MTHIRLLTFILLIVFSCSAIAQKKISYEKKWEEIEMLIQQKDLPESALQKTKELYHIAKTEKNHPQQIKALIYWIQLEERKSNNPGKMTISLLQEDGRSAEEPVKSILHSFLAEAYWRYLQQNRWNIQQRKTLEIADSSSLDTWSTNDFHKKIAAHFDSSLQASKMLTTVSLHEFDALLIKGNARHLRPTLFDLLAHRALNYYEEEERLISAGTDGFDASVSEFFLPATSFVLFSFDSKDSASPIYRAVKLYQQLIQFHLNDSKLSALADVDLRRIQFAHRFSVHSEKTMYYRKSLDRICQTYSAVPETAMAAYLLGASYADEAGTYDFKKFPVNDSSNPRWLYQNVLKICKPFINTSTPSEGSTQCQNLIRQIERKELLLKTEEVNIPGQPFRILVGYRNTPRLWFRVIPMNREQFEETMKISWMEDGWRALSKLQPIHAFSQNMPSTEDYQLHHTEIRIPALKNGSYIILISATEDFSTTENVLTAQLVTVSRLSWILQNQKLYVLNRESGVPVRGAQVLIQRNVYNYSKGIFEKTPGPSYVSKEDGSVELLSRSSDQINEYPIVTYEKDTLSLESPIPYYYWNPELSKKTAPPVRKTILFTDRSVFRPGQTVYFKGLLLETFTDSNITKIIPGVPVKVFLYNVSSQKIDSLNCTTNEFGSYNGQFTLPASVLNGFFSISIAAAEGNQSFLVEAYKRPKFYVQMQPPTHAYKVKDTIRMTGIVQAYAGYALQQVAVRYRVVRKARLPYPWLCYRWGWPALKEEEISHGTTMTDATGQFRIAFTARPDLSVRPELNPLFDYEVYADATDLNGETQNGTSTITAGYQSLILELNVSGNGSISADSLRAIYITTRNSMQVFEPALVSIQIHQLRSPNKLIRERLWEQPDQFVIDENSYRKDFPYDEYKDETSKESWEKTTRILSDTFRTVENKTYTFKGIQWKPGWYIAEAETKDQYGTSVRQYIYFEVLQSTLSRPFSPGYLWLSELPNNSKPGDQISFKIETDVENLYLIKTIQNNTDSPEQKTILLQKSIQETKKISEQDRGGFQIQYCFVKHNRFHQINRQVYVPYTNRELRFQYESFRNKTKPGSKEKWTIRIKEQNGTKPQTELLTTLYDASLDVYYKNPWMSPSLYPVVKTLSPWISGGFQAIYGLSGSFLQNAWNYVEKNYDRLPDLPASFSWMNVRPVMADAMFVQTNKESNVNKEIKGQSDTTTRNKKKPVEKESVFIRKDFRETAFFFPSLKTDTAGSITFEYSMPDALTTWKWQLFAHTKELLTAVDSKEIITQKELMIEPVLPRFVRSGDLFQATARITNLSDQDLSGDAFIELYDDQGNILTGEWLQKNPTQQQFSCSKGAGTAVLFKVHVPENFSGPLTYRFTARATHNNGNEYTDGEESIIPVLPNEILITESLPINIRSGDSLTLKWKTLEDAKKSTSLKHQSFTVEYTTNPVWLAVQALPFLTRTANESIEQTWNRFYAHALALHIIKRYPAIQNQINWWYQQDSTAFLSQLQKNEEVKTMLLQESPWILQALEEAEQRKEILNLMDSAFLNREMLSTIQMIIQQQTPNGGFCWFTGGKEDRYMTQYLLTGIGQLDKLGVLPASIQEQLQPVIVKALQYLDQQLLNDYNQMLKHKKNAKGIQPGYLQTEQMFMRSFFDRFPYSASSGKAYAFFLKKASLSWMKQDLYTRALLLQIFHRKGMQKSVNSIIRSMKEYAIRDSVKGIYFREFNLAYRYRSSIEMQSILIQALEETKNDSLFIEGLKTWLLQQKRNRQWINSKSTATACYTLLVSGKPWIEQKVNLQIQFGQTLIQSNFEAEGSGYGRNTYHGTEIKDDWSDIKIKTNATSGYSSPVYGGIYWQYLEQLKKIKSISGSLSVEKELLVKKYTPGGIVLSKITDTTSLYPGDQVHIRWIIRNDQLLNYVYLKDLRPACLEPINKSSGYHWQSGLSYYESIRDSGTDFFIDLLPAGTHLLESEFYVTHSGIFSSGSSMVQSLYTPELISNSNGGQIQIK